MFDVFSVHLVLARLVNQCTFGGLEMWEMIDLPRHLGACSVQLYSRDIFQS